MTPTLIRQRRQQDVLALQSQCSMLSASFEEINGLYHNIDTLYSGILSLESLIDGIPSLEGMDINAKAIINNILSYQERALGMEAIDVVSIESVRDRLKEVWKVLVKSIGTVMKKVALWSESMTKTIPAIRTHASTMISQAANLSEISGTVMLGNQVTYLRTSPNGKIDLANGIREVMANLREFLLIDSLVSIANAKTTASLMKDSVKVYDIENLNSNDNAKEHIKQLLVGSGLDKRINASSPPPGPWKKAVVIKGLTTLDTITFVYDDTPMLGGRMAVYKFPAMDSNNPDLLLDSRPITVLDYAQAAIQRIKGSKVGIVSTTGNGTSRDEKLSPLQPNDITASCNAVLDMCDIIEGFNRNYDEVSKVKEGLVKAGNSAMGIIDDEDNVRGKISDMMRHLVIYHNDRVDKPYVPMVNHCINVIRSTLSYCDKSLQVGYNISN